MRELTFHGGRLSAAEALFPDGPRPWIDLSTGVNPWPYPARPAGAAARARLPDPAETTALEVTAAGAFGVPAACVLATAGSEAGIRLIAASLPTRKVAIVEPTYGGHRDAWSHAGVAVAAIARSELVDAAARFDAVVVVDPNNPDGATSPAGDLLASAARLAARGGWLIVDQAFAEATPSADVDGSIRLENPPAGMVALRSFGKFFGLPGLRLGFTIAHHDLIAALRQRQGEWPVSADAIAAGRQAYADRAWAKTTGSRLIEAAARMDGLLCAAGMRIAGGTTLFRLTRCQDAAARFERLARAGVLCRPFASQPDALRFGLAADEHWPRVQAAVMETARMETA